MMRSTKKNLNKIYKRFRRGTLYLNRVINQFEWGQFSELKPISNDFGAGRGTPIDRYYILNFLIKNNQKIRGRILEVGSSDYANQFSKADDLVEILSPNSNNKRAALVADLAKLDELPESKYDCFICTQTLNFIFEYNAAISGIYKLLKPGGVGLITVAGLTHVSRFDMDRWGDYWRFNSLSLEKCLTNVFNKEKIQVTAYGNAKTAIGQIYGLCAEDYQPGELDFVDPDYQLLIVAIVEK